ncbi:MAG: helix-turn-helix transcriptional regulator [Trueperaceae bacterium]|nr:helix-turn-helix transcriptional regulator [Trueperaceae bacterium]
MSAKRKKPAPDVDEVTPELKDLIAHFSEEEVETGVVVRSTDAPASTRRYDAYDVQRRFEAARAERSLSRLLRSARSTAGLSLADVAERLGVSRSWIQQVEKEGANLQIDTLRRVADALGYDVHVSFVARDEDEPSLTAPLS